MLRTVLQGKLHGAVVTGANLHYEGSIGIDPRLYEKAGMFEHEKVDVVNLNNGVRFSTYIIKGKDRECCLNGAAARLAEPGDTLIIISYALADPSEREKHRPKIVFLDEHNEIRS